jgi:hypothetical protein
LARDVICVIKRSASKNAIDFLGRSMQDETSHRQAVAGHHRKVLGDECDKQTISAFRFLEDIVKSREMKGFHVLRNRATFHYDRQLPVLSPQEIVEQQRDRQWSCTVWRRRLSPKGTSFGASVIGETRRVYGVLRHAPPPHAPLR